LTQPRQQATKQATRANRSEWRQKKHPHREHARPVSTAAVAVAASRGDPKESAAPPVCLASSPGSPCGRHQHRVASQSRRRGCVAQASESASHRRHATAHATTHGARQGSRSRWSILGRCGNPINHQHVLRHGRSASTRQIGRSNRKGEGWRSVCDAGATKKVKGRQ
jgi:hypothetical protein